jgi:arylsulfatase A-like enzyme
MSDDHTTQAFGCYGRRLAKLNPTPNLDRLASEGIVLDNVFCNNSICVPSRASIMTGQYSAVNELYTLGGALEHDQQFLAHEMRKAGYQTAVVGKWHLGARPSAFDYYKVLEGQGCYDDPDFVEGSFGDTEGTLVQTKGHSSDIVTDTVLDWFRNKRDPSKPFFVKFHFKAPHGPFKPAPRYADYLKDVFIPEPETLYAEGNHGSLATKGRNGELVSYIGTSVGRRSHFRRFSDKYAQDKKAIPNPEYTDREAKSLAHQGYLKDYLGCVKGVDDNVQRVFDYLKAEGLYDNTVIVYTGDQGFYLGEHDYTDKRWPYEESMRMPLIVRYPKTIQAGSRNDSIIENVDFAPMLLDYAGVETPDYMQGKSFRSILETGKEQADWKQAAYYHYWLHLVHHKIPANIAIRTKEYKLIFYYSTHWQSDEPDTPFAWELYDLVNDPNEMNNLYDDPKYVDVVKKLKVQLKALRAEYREDDPKYPFNKVIDQYWDYTAEDRVMAESLIEPYIEACESVPKDQKARKTMLGKLKGDQQLKWDLK